MHLNYLVALLPLWNWRAHSGRKPKLHGFNGFKTSCAKCTVRQRWQSDLYCTTIEVEMYTSYKCNAIVSASHKEDNHTRDQPVFRENVMTWQQTASFGWKGQIWFVSTILILLFVQPPACLSQTFSHGLTQLHNQQKHHAPNITFIQTRVSEQITVWWNRKYVFFNFCDMKDWASKRKGGGCEQPMTIQRNY